MSEREQDQYGTVQPPEPISVEIGGPFIATTPMPLAAPDEAIKTYHAMMRKDLRIRRERDAG